MCVVVQIIIEMQPAVTCCVSKVNLDATHVSQHVCMCVTEVEQNSDHVIKRRRQINLFATVFRVPKRTQGCASAVGWELLMHPYSSCRLREEQHL